MRQQYIFHNMLHIHINQGEHYSTNAFLYLQVCS